MNEYKLLDKTTNEDVEKIREYAKAKTELKVLETRFDFLETLLEENKELRQSVWTTAQGESMAISDIEDDHLKNIVIHMKKQGQYNQRIVTECQKRQLEVPKMLEIEHPF